MLLISSSWMDLRAVVGDRLLGCRSWVSVHRMGMGMTARAGQHGEPRLYEAQQWSIGIARNTNGWIEDDMEVWIQGSLDTELEDGVGYHGIC
jgi:hypothetical protein